MHPRGAFTARCRAEKGVGSQCRSALRSRDFRMGRLISIHSSLSYCFQSS